MGPAAPGGQSGEAVIARRLRSKGLIVYCWLICFESSSQYLNIDCTSEDDKSFLSNNMKSTSTSKKAPMPFVCLIVVVPGLSPIFSHWAVSHEEPRDNLLMWSTAQVRNTRKPLKTIRGCKSTQETLLYLCQRSPSKAETSQYGTSQLFGAYSDKPSTIMSQ